MNVHSRQILPRFVVSILITGIFSLIIGASAQARGSTHQHHHSYILVLDPGHGGSDPGAADNGEVEKTLTLQVALQAASALKSMGYRVYLTRTRDQDVNTPPRDLNGDGHIDHVDEFDARNLVVNRHHADVFVSIHFDAAVDPSIHGTHGYYCPDRPFWRQSKALAGHITAAITLALKQKGYVSSNNGIETDVADVVPQTRADYPWFLVLGPSLHHFVTGTAMPGALIESLYLTSPRDASALRNSATIEAIAHGYAEGVLSYFHGRTER